MAPIEASRQTSTPEYLGQCRLECAQPAVSAWRRMGRWQVWPQTTLRTKLPASSLFPFLPARQFEDGSSLAPSSMLDMPQAAPGCSPAAYVSRAVHRAPDD